MTLPQPLKDMCRHVVRVETYAGTSSQGARAYSTGNDYPARIVGKRSIVKDAAGNNVISQGRIYVATDIYIDPKSRVTLPSAALAGTNSSQPPIMAVEYFPDAVTNGLSHCVVYV